MRKLLLPALVVAVGAAAWVVLQRVVRPGEGTAGEDPLRTATVSRRDIGSTVLATGVIRPKVGAEVQVGSRVSGILQRLHVDVGDRVEAGQILAELDPTEFSAQVAQARAALENAVAEKEFAEAELRRAQGLADKNFIPESEYDAAQRAYRVSAARVGQAEANLSSAEIMLGYTKIRAPIAGVVASVSTQVGETVAASFAAPTFVTIIDLERLEVWAYVDETDIGRVEVGQEATFTVDTYVGTDFEGRVTAIRPRAEIIDNVVNYVTVIEIGDRQGRILRPEMTTTVNIILEGRSEVVAIPNGAVRRDGNGSFVLVVEGEGLVRRAIRTGYRGREYTEVTDGLAEGEVVAAGPVNAERTRTRGPS
jgi:macrolide-specific efflux system membrane fusion protein